MSIKERFRGYPVAAGAAAGSLAWVVGVVITYVAVLVFLEPPEDAGQPTDPSPGFGDIGDEIGDQLAQSLAQIPFEGSGMIYFNAHFVPTEVDVLIFSQSFNFIGILGGSWSALYVLPPVALTLAGATIVRRYPAGDASEAAKTGASVVAGYLPLVAIGTFLFTISLSISSGFSATISIGPGKGMGIGVAGIVYPLLFGAVGGYLGWQVWGRPATPRKRPPRDGARDRRSSGGQGQYRDHRSHGRERQPRDVARDRRSPGPEPRPRNDSVDREAIDGQDDADGFDRQMSDSAGRDEHGDRTE